MKLKNYNVTINNEIYPVIGLMQAFDMNYILVTKEMYNQNLGVAVLKNTVVKKYKHTVFDKKDYMFFNYKKLDDTCKMNHALEFKFNQFINET